MAYGLDAQLFTENLSRAHRVSARLNVGTVWVNCFFTETCGHLSAAPVPQALAAKAATSAVSSSPSPRLSLCR